MRIYSLVLCGILVCSALFGQTRPSILQLKDLPVADVRSFGAVGDGVEDDTSAIQAAINDTTADTIVFPPGKYKVTSTLVINRTGVKLVGFGGDSTDATPLYLENMAYVPVGKSFRIIKNDGASRGGFFVLPPFGGAMTIIGDASNVGGFRVATNPAVIEYTKIATDTIMGVSIR